MRPKNAPSETHLKRMTAIRAALRRSVVALGKGGREVGCRFGDRDELKREKALAFMTLAPVSAED